MDLTFAFHSLAFRSRFSFTFFRRFSFYIDFAFPFHRLAFSRGFTFAFDWGFAFAFRRGFALAFDWGFAFAFSRGFAFAFSRGFTFAFCRRFTFAFSRGFAFDGSFAFGSFALNREHFHGFRFNPSKSSHFSAYRKDNSIVSRLPIGMLWIPQIRSTAVSKLPKPSLNIKTIQFGCISKGNGQGGLSFRRAYRKVHHNIQISRKDSNNSFPFENIPA
ncbi:MAG: hypothetical protein BWX80_01482 [Candidatus Hydrogenedentes bacterium ADurb.Bin101]|nr:MAG: hypothetical protein BWX80_01482 [Candidatus Hydrogenedentes bacterium ADurb.Bin101]